MSNSGHLLSITRFKPPALSGLSVRNSNPPALAGGCLVMVCYTLRGDVIRLISARMATKNERRQYES